MEQKFLRLLGKPAVIRFLTSWLVSRILSLFIPWMEIDERHELPSNDGIKNVFLISYAANEQGLTCMSLNTTLLAILLAYEYPDSRIFSCEFRDNPEGSKEFASKKVLALRNSLFGRIKNAGNASSTTDERELLVAKALEVNGGTTIGPSIIVGNGAHIRRARMVWRHYHPKEKLWFVSTPMKGDDDPNSPMIAQRYWQTWIVANLFGLPVYKILGVEYFAKKNLSQPVN